MGKQYGVRCDDDFQAQIEEAAKARGWSVPDLFREATRQYIKGDEFHRLLVDFEKRQAVASNPCTGRCAACGTKCRCS